MADFKSKLGRSQTLGLKCGQYRQGAGEVRAGEKGEARMRVSGPLTKAGTTPLGRSANRFEISN
jgi:hypothetical protein